MSAYLNNMNTLARWLAVYLALVLFDALMGFRLYQRAVYAATGGWCKLTNRDDLYRAQCTNRIFYSRALWLLISSGMGLAGGYVAAQALATRRW